MLSPFSAPSSDTSPPLSPRARMTFPFLGAKSIPLKSPPSPPSLILTPSSDLAVSDVSVASSGPMSPISTTASYTSCAYPSWPRSDILSPASSISSTSSSSSSPAMSPSFGAYTGCQASSYITDEDLLDLATLPLYNNIRIPPEMLVAATPAQDVAWEKRRPRSQRVILPESVAVQQCSLPAEVSIQPAEPSLKRRRRSSPLKRRKLVLGLSPVVEGAE